MKRALCKHRRAGNGWGTLPVAVFALFAVVLAIPREAQADITNTATAAGSYAGSTIISPPSSFAVPVAAAKAAMTVVKTASPTAGLKAGGIVTYTYVVKNTGNITLHHISLADLHNASGPAPLPSGETLTDVPPLDDSTDSTVNDGLWTNLAPGDSVTFTATYTVTQHDQDTLQ